MLYSDMTRTPVISMSQWSSHVCACMHTNEMFSNWEKSREGESNRKMRGREEKRGRKGRREGERGEEGGTQGDREREEERGWGEIRMESGEKQLISQGTLPHEFVHVLYSYLLAFPE